MVLTVLFTGTGFASAEDIGNEEHKNETLGIPGMENEIESFIYNYLINRYTLLGSLSDNLSIIDKYFVPTEEMYGSEYHKLLLGTMIEHNKLQMSDLHFNNLELSVKIDKIEDVDSELLVNYHVVAKYKYYCMDRYTEETYNYQQALINCTDKYLFKSIIMENDKNLEQFNNVLGINQNVKLSSTTSVKSKISFASAKQKILEQSKKDAISMKKAALSTASYGSDITLFAVSKSYNRAAAVNYALQWATTYNPVYESDSSPNCTNYVSQCLRAGGLPQDTNGNTDQKWFFNSRGDSSYSWKNAHGLYVYLTTNNGSTSNAGVKKISPYTTRSTILSNLATGDAVTYFSGGLSNGATHNAIVTNITYSSSGYRTDLVLCQHSASPNLNALFSTNFSTTTVHGEHVSTYYN